MKWLYLSTVTLEVKVEFRRMRDISVDDGTRRTVAAPVALVGALREEADVVPLSNDDHGDLGIDSEFLARSLKLGELWYGS